MTDQEISNDILKDAVLNVKTIGESPNEQDFKWIRVIEIQPSEESEVRFKIEASNEIGFKVISQAEATLVNQTLGIKFLLNGKERAH